ncbi:hypothetical protein U1Q18_028081 [Sarracenia purpurea var. burkii]
MPLTLLFSVPSIGYFDSIKACMERSLGRYDVPTFFVHYVSTEVFFMRYLTLASKLKVFEASGNLKSRSARWMEKRGGGSLPIVIDRESKFIFQPYLQLIDGLMPSIYEHEIYSIADMKVTQENVHARYVLAAVAMMPSGWLPALTSDGALVVMPYNPNRVAR